MSVAELKVMSLEEYLDWESRQETKHEFYNGLVYEVYAMTGARDAHVTVAGNVFSLLRSHLRGTPCRTYIADMRLKVDAANAVFYPDVFVTCDPRDKPVEYEKAFPALIVEVLSPSTAAYDRGSKFAAYRLIATLKEYVLIDTASRSVDVFRKDESGHWVLYPSEGCTRVEFASVGLRAELEAVFEDVEAGREQWPPQTH
ncbi:Uma2 family endonuclease [Methylococcus sp. EFPC2]|uniref:Uma2 family endonuclease n=1 Tax=Methylococcus sp. EFPC2 TaxID=2812648 RepID=UPI001966E56E|nr:Uma2 family endonuclease [Methylococcus sp. EFPC2]QSA96875.1 Uma2 family endonuclease [Methylococcus sp. EFPC2]